MTAVLSEEQTTQVSATRRGLVVLVLVIALALVCVASIFLGSQRISVDEVWSGLTTGAGDPGAIVQGMRVPRTFIGLAVGAALGIAGALIQGFTRNPLADPGILGVNAGASLGVTTGVAFFGLTAASGYIWFAFAGATVATVLVYLIGSAGRTAPDPMRMTLSGVALGAVMGGVVAAIGLLNPKAFDSIRWWNAGSLSALTPDVYSVLPFLLLGLVLAFCLAPSLNALALGDDLATALGSRVVLTRVLSIVAVTLLCGAATAAAGPIAFVGLMVPHAVRWFVGPHQGWILLGTVFAAPLLLLTADVVGRLVLRTGELPVSVVTALIGAPVLIALVRRKKVSGL
ncbi:iron complex transport system permease protein [Microbacterium phyllosphaerae]|uniref:Iron complex transport system permease protein n=1 Tax=Microbacterium phyllosphaerae TaxID=124798 RepID=A0ABS4WRM2_9MICO|nr:iron chelate uptake ABC transporter family permease subunit [Microbacterium phyllosphaerae]MBP2378869.1 iron complex transport system permease protein [Microbacterium phyllosphaerae]